ncbi:MAG: hypothetical protein PHX68_01800 [Alphaproteobacteria bacterium]|nr:hypothetical protein [Alphaproteobacteria bacterium]
MAEQAPNNSLLSAFTATKEEQIGGVIRHAQKLVNLYHHLNDFPPAFLETFNRQLLEASSDIQRTINDLQGGNIVRQYADFVRAKTAPAQQADNSSDKKESAGYLPDPSEETALPAGPAAPVAAPAGAVPEMLAHDIKALQENFEKLQAAHQRTTLATLEKLIQAQTQMLAGVLQQLPCDSPAQPVRRPQPAAPDFMAENIPYSDVIEEEKAVQAPPVPKRATAGTPASAFVPSKGAAPARPLPPLTHKG